MGFLICGMTLRVQYLNVAVDCSIISININDVIHPKHTQVWVLRTLGQLECANSASRQSQGITIVNIMGIKTTLGSTGQEKRVELYLVRDKVA